MPSNVKIGSMQVGDKPADIIYLGGSTFSIDFNDESSEPLIAKKDNIDKWINEGYVTLVSPSIYSDILSSIDPETGETATHHADGSEKTLIEIELGKLQTEGHVEDSSIDSYIQSKTGAKDDEEETPDNEDIDKPMPRPSMVQQGGMGIDRPIPTGDQQYGDIMASPDEKPFQDMDESVKHTLGAADRKPPKNIPIIAYCATMTLLGFIALFGFRGIMSSSMRTQPNSQQTSYISSGTQDAEEPNSSESDNIIADSDTIKRTDYDPEDDVISYPMADQEQIDMITSMFSKIRECFENGDPETYQKIVALSTIGNQIGKAYAQQEQLRHFMTDEDTIATMEFYQSVFVRSEKNHAAKANLPGSIIGGRIREVRQDPHVPNKLYVVMESISGDHQRVCFIVEQVSENSWAVMGITSPRKYVQQIRAGNTLMHVEQLTK